jgi:Zn finger protein HypA/HybF involved in hydrogenase expression
MEDNNFKCESCDAEFLLETLESDEEPAFCPYCGSETITVDDDVDFDLDDDEEDFE